MGTLLQQGIGDTIRISLTPEPGGDRTLEVKVAQELLQTMGFRTFVPLVAAFPGCGRTTSTTFQEFARRHPGLHPRLDAGVEEALSRRRVAQRRGDGLHRQRPGRSKHADIGISLPGTGESPAAPVFIDGKKATTLRGPTVAADFQKLVIEDIDRRFGHGGAGTHGGGVGPPRMRRVSSTATFRCKRLLPVMWIGLVLLFTVIFAILGLRTGQVCGAVFDRRRRADAGARLFHVPPARV